MKTDFPVRAEIIMEPQHEQIVEVAIARNTCDVGEERFSGWRARLS